MTVNRERRLETGLPSGDERGSTVRRPVIGLLVDHILASYQNELLLALVAAVREQGANLFCFTGSTLHEAHTPWNDVYALASPDTVDALIISSATLESRIGSKRLSRFLTRFERLPKVSLGIALPDIPSVLVNNAAGVQKIVSHMVTEHGRRNIAFIRGPAANEEADQRYRGYLKALLDSRQYPTDQLVVDGDFMRESGQRAIRTLLDQRRVKFDAVVAANDLMALGAMDELCVRRISVPETVSVVGFDDLLAARFAVSPLTTVRQQLPEQAKQAVRMALAQLRGELVQERLLIDTELVLRRSCGCPIETRSFEVKVPPRPRKGKLESPLIDRRDEILEDMTDAAPELAASGWLARLLDAFVAQLMGKSTGFAQTLGHMLVDPDVVTDVRELQQLMSALRVGAIPALVEHPGMLLRAETMLHEGRLLLADAVERREVQRRLRSEAWGGALSDIAQALITSMDETSLAEGVKKSLASLEIPSCFLAVYAEPEQQADAERILRLILAYDRQRGPLPLNPNETFRFEALLPDALLPSDRAFAYVVEPLFFRERPLGIALFEMGPPEGAVYETLRAQVSAALEGLLLVGELARGNEKRQRLLRRILVHGEALRQAHETLRQPKSESLAPSDPSEAAAAPTHVDAEGALRIAVEELGALIAECSALMRHELDTLRPEDAGSKEDGSVPSLS
jgi:DNA-binding LacI/PurR family transcriptional regulator